MAALSLADLAICFAVWVALALVAVAIVVGGGQK